MKKAILVTVLLIISFVVNILLSTGTFRMVENVSEWKLKKEIGIPGAEDITVSITDSFAIISSTLRTGFPPSEEEFGALYFMDLKAENYTLKNLTTTLNIPFAPHGISLYKMDSTYKVMAVNHTPNGHSIEVFSLYGDSLVHEKTMTHPLMVSPNDIVMINEKQFYFTNDHGHAKGFRRLAEDYLGLSLSNVIYFDGTKFSKAAEGVAFANGINYDAKRQLLYVASSRKFLVKVYSKMHDGTLEFIEDINCGTGVDNIEFNEEGVLYVGAHPKLLTFAAYVKGDNEISPSEIIKIHYKGKGRYIVESIYSEDGSTMSASSVAAPYADIILTGNVMDSKFLILKKSN